jgi:hypothetical protein
VAVPYQVGLLPFGLSALRDDGLHTAWVGNPSCASPCTLLRQRSLPTIEAIPSQAQRLKLKGGLLEACENLKTHAVLLLRVRLGGRRSHQPRPGCLSSCIPFQPSGPDSNSLRLNAVGSLCDPGCQQTKATWLAIKMLPCPLSTMLARSSFSLSCSMSDQGHNPSQGLR